MTHKLLDALDSLSNYRTRDGEFWRYSRLPAEKLLPPNDWRLKEILKFRSNVKQDEEQ